MFLTDLDFFFESLQIKVLGVGFIAEFCEKLFSYLFALAKQAESLLKMASFKQDFCVIATKFDQRLVGMVVSFGYS